MTRLDGIKERWRITRGAAIDSEHVEWLIERAERCQELEEQLLNAKTIIAQALHHD